MAPHRGRTLDLVGPPVTAARVADRLGVPHRGIGLGEYRRRLLDETPGLLPFQPPMLASIATGIRHGFLARTTPDLTDLLGRPARDPLAVATATAAACPAAASAWRGGVRVGCPWRSAPRSVGGLSGRGRGPSARGALRAVLPAACPAAVSAWRGGVRGGVRVGCSWRSASRSVGGSTGRSRGPSVRSVSRAVPPVRPAAAAVRRAVAPLVRSSARPTVRPLARATRRPAGSVAVSAGAAPAGGRSAAGCSTAPSPCPWPGRRSAGRGAGW